MSMLLKECSRAGLEEHVADMRIPNTKYQSGTLNDRYEVLDNNAAGNFLMSLVYGVIDGIYTDEYVHDQVWY